MKTRPNIRRLLSAFQLFSVSAFLFTGCVQTRLQTPDVIFTTTRFFWNGEIGGASVATNGTISLHGYRSESEKLAEAIARGVSQGIQP
jgi:hypothetical protein